MYEHSPVGRNLPAGAILTSLKFRGLRGTPCLVKGWVLSLRAQRSGPRGVPLSWGR